MGGCKWSFLELGQQAAETEFEMMGLSASVCSTGSFSAHTATHSTSENAHKTQSLSTEFTEISKKHHNRILDTSITTIFKRAPPDIK